MELIDRTTTLKNMKKITKKYRNKESITAGEVCDMAVELVGVVASQPTVNAWRSVEDRLPFKYQIVVAKDNEDRLYILTYADGEFTNEQDEAYEVIAWMPIFE